MSIVDNKNNLIFEASKLHDKIMADMLMLARVDYTPNRVYLGDQNWKILSDIGLGICTKRDPKLDPNERKFLGLKVFIVKNDPTHMQVM